MPSIVKGDFSKFPQEIQDVFPQFLGEVTELRECWELYERLFMCDRTLTALLCEQLGPLLGVVQDLLEDRMFLIIFRVTDKSKTQRNNSLSSLISKLANDNRTDFMKKARAHAMEIEKSARDIVLHRHKRIAHSDWSASVNPTSLPVVTLEQLKLILEKLECFLNLLYWEFEQTEIVGHPSALDLTTTAENCALKAKAYDLFEKTGMIPVGEWRRQKLMG